MAFKNAEAPRLLIVRRDNIGDLACTTPLIAALRARWPGAWLGALVTTYNTEVLARNPALDFVSAYEKLKHRREHLLPYLWRRFQQARGLRQLDLDAVLVPAPAPQAVKIARRLQSGEVIVAPTSFRSDAHEVERCFDLGRALGVTGAAGPMQIYPDPEAIAVLRRRIGEGPFTAVHISARRPAQRWPLERYAELVRTLGARQRILLLWAPGARGQAAHPGDDEAAATVLRLAGSADVTAVPTPDLKTLIAALALCDKVICPDGGAMHLAAALGKRVVALFGDAPVSRWRPWAVPHRVVQGASGQLADLPVAAVLQAEREVA